MNDPFGWREVSFDDLVKVVAPPAKVPRSKYQIEGRHPVIDQGQKFIGGYVDDSSLLNVKNLPVIVFGDHTRIVKFADFPFACGADGVKLLLPREPFDPRFTFYLLESQPVNNLGYSRHFSLLKELVFKVPPLAEQREIAVILFSVDETIGKTEAVIERLRNAQQAVMQALLKRGLPGRHSKYLPLKAEWRLGRLEGVAEIPDSWTLVRLTSEARLESGHTPSKRNPEYWDGDIPWVSLHDSKHLDVHEILDTAQKVSALGIDNSSARLLPRGTVVFSRTATVGKSTVLGRDMATSQDFANYICGESIHNRYLMHLFRNMGQEWSRLMSGSTHKTIYMPVFQELQVLLPRKEEQEMIATLGDLLESRVVAETKTLYSLRLLKAALLRNLLSGEIRAPLAETETAA